MEMDEFVWAVRKNGIAADRLRRKNERRSNEIHRHF